MKLRIAIQEQACLLIIDCSLTIADFKTAGESLCVCIMYFLTFNNVMRTCVAILHAYDL